MNMQCTMQSSLSRATTPTCMPVTSARPSCLLIPIWPVVRIEATAPRRIDLACHSVPMFFSKACTATKALSVSLNLIRLSVKLRAARGASNYDACRFSNKAIRALPSAPTLTATKIMITDVTRGNLFMRAAPIARNQGRWIVAYTAAIMIAWSIGMPRRKHYGFSASRTSDRNLNALRSSRALAAAIFANAFRVVVNWKLNSASNTELHISSPKTTLYVIIARKEGEVKEMKKMLSVLCYKLMNPDAPVKVSGAAPIPDGQTTLW